MTARRFLLWGSILLIFLLTACSGGGEPAATPTLQTLNVDVTPSALPVIPALDRCAGEIGGLEISITEVYAEYSEGDLLVRLGEPASLPGFAAQIGQEELTVIMNPQNSTGSLTPGEIQSLFSGQVTNWSQLGGPNALVNVWVPLAGDEIRTAFENTIMQGLPVVSNARLAPDALAMQQAVSADPYAIGYVSTANMTFSALQHVLPGVRLPVLVLADGQPMGITVEFVACLQTGSGQETLSEIYP